MSTLAKKSLIVAAAVAAAGGALFFVRMIGAGPKAPLEFDGGYAQDMVQIVWHHSLADAITEAQRRNTLILVDAYADWCIWCKKLDEDTLSNPRVHAQMKEFTLLKVNTDEQVDLARRFGVTGLPTTVILNAEGEVVLSQSGYLPPESYLELLAEAHRRAG